MRRLGAVVVIGAAVMAGCGPVVSGVQIVRAGVEISAAETAGAKEQAPYEYTAAVEYLQKSREEHGYSDFAASREYADKAREFAIRAREKAQTLTAIDQPAILPEPEAQE